jgi:hypothetical protein
MRRAEIRKAAQQRRNLEIKDALLRLSERVKSIREKYWQDLEGGEDAELFAAQESFRKLAQARNHGIQ